MNQFPIAHKEMCVSQLCPNPHTIHVFESRKVTTLARKDIHFSGFRTLGQKSTFYPEITKNLMFEKCEFCEK